jgi:hypothetical protein
MTKEKAFGRRRKRKGSIRLGGDWPFGIGFIQKGKD